MKMSLKNRPRILLNFFAIIPIQVGAEERGPHPSSNTGGRICRLVSCAGTEKKCTKRRDARTELLFCSLNLLFFDVPVAVAS